MGARWDGWILWGGLAIVAGGAGWYFLLGPGAEQRSQSRAAESESRTAEVEKFISHARIVDQGDSIKDIEAQMGRPADRVRRRTGGDEEHVWQAPDGTTFTVAVDGATGRASRIVL